MEEEKSEFGKGFTYCLGLFLCHADRRFKDKEREKSSQTNLAFIWLNGAADHLFEFDAEKAPKPKRDRCQKLQDNVLGRRLAYDVTWEEIEGYIEEAKTILLEYDKFCGFEVIKANYN